MIVGDEEVVAASGASAIVMVGTVIMMMGTLRAILEDFGECEGCF